MPINAVRQVVSGLAGNFTKGLIGGLAGNARGAINGRGADNSPASGIQNKSKFYTNNLSYPSDVETDVQQGHYILFHINENQKAKLKRAKKSKNIDAIINKAKKDHDIETRSIDDFGVAEDDDIIINQKKLQSAGSKKSAISGAKHNLYAEQFPTTRLATSIALYMPPTVQTTYSLDYQDIEIGMFGEGLKQVFDTIEAAMKNRSAEAAASGKAAFGTLEEGVKRMLMKSMDTFAPGIKASQQIRDGKILSNKMELSFKGVNRRTFNFSFVFMPKSEQESTTVQHIVHMFKYHSHPEWGGGGKKTGREMTIPDTFDIEYMYKDGVNHWLNKISTCFLKDINVSYGGDRFTAFRPAQGLHGAGAPPSRVAMTLTFQEMEILVRDRIDECF